MQQGEDRGFAKNSVFFFIARAIDVLTGIISIVLIARYLGSQIYGEYAFILAYVGSIIPLAYFGLERISIRELSKNRERAQEYLGAIIISRWIMSLGALVIFTVTLLFVHINNHLFIAIIIVLTAELFNASASAFSAVFIAYERMQYETLITTMWKGAYLLLLTITIYADKGINGICSALMLSNALRALISIIAVRKRFAKPAYSFNYPLIKNIIKDSMVLGISVLFAIWYLKSGLILIRFFKDPVQVAFFQISQSAVIQSRIIAISISVSLFPMISKLAKMSSEGSQKISEVYEKAYNTLLVVALSMTIFFIAFAKEIILLLFGHKYANAAFTFKVTSLAIIPLFITSLNEYFYISYHEQRYITLSWLICLVFNILCSTVLIPGYGSTGAALSFTFGLIALSFIHAFFSSRAGLSFIKISPIKLSIFLLISLIIFGFVDEGQALFIRFLIVFSVITTVLVYWRYKGWLKTIVIH
jgi:O-antigen/teichoic acid export membrane protein